MNLSEIYEVNKRIAEQVGGQVLRKEFLMTNKEIYVTVNIVDDITDFILWSTSNDVVPLLVVQNVLEYAVGDEFVNENPLFEALSTDVLAVQANKLLTIKEGRVQKIEVLEENAL